jgi:hypothetical protein
VAALGIAGLAGREDLDGDKAIEPRILSLVDLAHSAGAELLDDLIMKDSLADHKSIGTETS